MSKKPKKAKRPKPEREAEAVRDVARVMYAWAARLGPASPVGLRYQRGADRALELLNAGGHRP